MQKAGGEVEAFKPKKLMRSCFSAGLAAGLDRNEAKDMANVCIRGVRSELRKHKHISSREIRRVAIKSLEKSNKAVALMYKAVKEEIG